MHHLFAYLRQLSTARQILWCYLIWYLVMVGFHFEPTPRVWMTSLGISGVVGVGLILSVSSRDQSRDCWTTARLFLMPFCVSVFSALIKDRGFVLMFSPARQENLFAALGCALFLLLVRGVQRLTGLCVDAFQSDSSRTSPVRSAATRSDPAQ